MSAKQKFLDAIASGNIREVKNWLGHKGLQHPSQFEHPEYLYEYPYQVALEACGSKGTTPMFRFLVDQKFQINEQDSTGYRAVNYAACKRNIEALNYFVDHGANLSWPPGDRYSWCSALQAAIAHRPRQVKDDGDPRFEATIKWLIRNNCSFDTCKSWTPLHFMVGMGQHDVIPLLVNLGADANEMGFVVNGSRKCTPLLAYNGPYGDERGIRTVKALLESGADPEVAGPDGVTPAEYYKSILEKHADREEGRNELTQTIRLVEPDYLLSKVSSDLNAPLTNNGRELFGKVKTSYKQAQPGSSPQHPGSTGSTSPNGSAAPRSTPPPLQSANGNGLRNAVLTIIGVAIVSLFIFGRDEGNVIGIPTTNQAATRQGSFQTSDTVSLGTYVAIAAKNTSYLVSTRQAGSESFSLTTTDLEAQRGDEVLVTGGIPRLDLCQIEEGARYLRCSDLQNPPNLPAPYDPASYVEWRLPETISQEFRVFPVRRGRYATDPSQCDRSLSNLQDGRYAVIEIGSVSVSKNTLQSCTPNTVASRQSIYTFRSANCGEWTWDVTSETSFKALTGTNNGNDYEICGEINHKGTLQDFDAAEISGSERTAVAANTGPEERYLNSNQRILVENKLALLNYGRLEVDGFFDPNTRVAIRLWQGQKAHEVDGVLPENQFEELMKDSRRYSLTP